MEINAKKFYAPTVPSSNNNKKRRNSININNAVNKKKTTKEFLRLKKKLRKLSKKKNPPSYKLPKAYPKQQFAFDEMDVYNSRFVEYKNNHSDNDNNNIDKDRYISNIDSVDDDDDDEEEEAENNSSPKFSDSLTPRKKFNMQQERKNANEFKHRIFSQELASTGKRTFISCSISTFFYAYLNIPPRQRHYYEIIRQNSPCRLYFDCEFYKEFNPTVDGNGMINLFIRYVATALQSYFGIMVSLENFL